MEGSKRRKSKPTSPVSQVETDLPATEANEEVITADKVPTLDGESMQSLIELLRILDAIDKRAKGIRTT